MSIICNLINMLTTVLERDGAHPLHYCSNATTTCENRPAPYLEIAFLDEGSMQTMRMGEASFRFPAGHLAVFNVHFGNFAPANAKFRARCVFFELGAYRQFDFLADKPFFHSVRLAQPKPLQAAIDRLVMHSRLCAWQAPVQPAPAEFIDSRDDLRLVPAEALYLKSALLEIMAVATEAWNEESGGHKALPLAVKRGLDFIHLCYSKPDIDLMAISRAAYLDPSHFGRIFRNAMEKTPMRYLRSVRMAQASILLRQTDMSVGAIGEAVGLPNQFLFSRIFKYETGMSPLGYRRQVKNIFSP
jgi:AraC-like DNA-binding protein